MAFEEPRRQCSRGGQKTLGFCHLKSLSLLIAFATSSAHAERVNVFKAEILKFILVVDESSSRESFLQCTGSEFVIICLCNHAKTSL